MTEEHPVLNKEKLLNIVKKFENVSSSEDQSVEILEHLVKPGTEPGENYSSEFLACDIEAKVNGVSKKYSWVAKLPPKDKGRMPMAKETKMDKKEILMYSSYLPNLRKFVHSKDPMLQLDFCTSPYSEYDDTEEDLKSILVMENLKSKGFAEAKNKKSGLNLDYCLLVVEAMAKFHAASHSFFKEIPESSEQYKLLTKDILFCDPGPICSQLNKLMVKPITSMVLGFLEASQVSGQQSFRRAFEKYLAENGNDMFELRSKLYKGNPNEFQTLCLTDTWFNNMLFRHDENEVPVEVNLVDLAVIRWGSPVNDIVYFLSFSSTPQLRNEALDEILGHYHTTFCNTLAKLGQNKDILSLQQIKEKYAEVTPLGFIMSMAALPGCLCTKEDAFGQEDMAGNWQDPVEVEAMMEKIMVKAKRIFANVPQMKIMCEGNFMEMVKNGHVKL